MDSALDFDFSFLMGSLPYYIIGLGVAIALLVVALKGINETGANGWKLLLVAQIISLFMITVRMVPMLMMAGGNYSVYEMMGSAFNIFGMVGDLAIGILMVASLGQILSVAKTKEPPTPPYPDNW